MAQSLDLRVSILDAKAKVELKEIDGKIQQIQKRAEKGINLVSSVETRDAQGKLKGIVDTYKDAADKIEVYAQRINKSGNVSFSVTAKSGVNWAEKQAQAYGEAIIKQEELERSFTKITASVSSFASLSDQAFQQYSTGAMSAAKATEESARAVQISAKDWQAMWNTFHNIGVECGVTANDVSVFGRLSDEAFAQYSSGAMTAEEANKTLRPSTEKIGKAAEKTSHSFTAMNAILLRLAHVAIRAVTRSFRQAFTEMQNVDKQLTTVSRITQKSISDLDALKQKAYEVGNAYGVMASDYLSAAAAFTRAGYREQAEELAELSSKLQIAGQVSADVANQFLIATDKAYKFNGSVTKLSSVMDKLTVIDHNYATSVEKIADGMGIVAPVAAQAHMSVDELIASLGTITAVTQRSGTEAARALRALILSIIKDTTTEIDEGVTWTVEEINSLQDALKLYAPEVVKAAEATGQLIDPMEAIAALAKSYEDGLLTEAKLAQLTSKLGGKLRASQLLSLIQNYSGMYTKMMSDMGNAIGAVDADVDKALQSWEQKLNQLKNSFTGFIESVFNTDAIKDFIDAINYVIKAIDNPDEYAEKFASAFESAIHSIADNAPRILDSINKVATMVVKSVLSSLAKEAPDFIQNVLTEGIKDTFSTISENLPELAGDFFSVIGTMVAQGILNADLANVIANEIVGGVLTAIPDIVVGFFKGIYSGAEAFGSGDKNWLKALAKLTQTEGELTLAARIVSWFVPDSGDVHEALDALAEDIKKVKDASSNIIEEDTVELVTDEAVKSVEGLTDELEKATKALDKYKKALESGEKGDALKSYSEAYKKAVELAQKGLTGTNQYMSAIDLIFGEVDDYEKAAELLDNAFIKAMFEGGGEDFGAAAANWIRQNIENLEGVALREGEDGTFGLDFFDVDAFAEQMKVSSDAVWILIDALDAYNSKKTYTRDQLFNFMGLEDDGREKFVNLTALINDLAGQGKTAREIKDIVDAIKELAKTDGNIEISEPEDLDQTIKDIVELNKEAEKDKDMEVVLTSNSDAFFDGIRKEIKELNGTTIYVGLKLKPSESSSSESSSSESRSTPTYFSDAISGDFGFYSSGTRSARGGLSLVNEEGAEIIYANGKAWIAGGGDPTITNLPVGAGVFNAKETREILTRSGIESHDGKGAYVGGIKITTGGGGKAGSGKLTESLLEQIAEYINDILKKAKEALQEQLDAIDEQIEKLKREHNAEEDANKLEELRLKILEKEKKLAEAENERTVRYFNKETGQWEWMADQKAVADAQKALKEAQEAYDKEVAEQAYQAQLQALQDQKDSLNEAYNTIADSWETIYEELENILNGKGTVDIAKLIQQLLGTNGGSYAQDIQSLLEAIGAFTANPTSVLDTATTARIMSMNGATGGATSVLSAMLGSGSYDLNGKGQSTLSGNTSIVGDTIYYINGVQIGSDMMNKPLSQILSVLPIYAN